MHAQSAANSTRAVHGRVARGEAHFYAYGQERINGEKAGQHWPSSGSVRVHTNPLCTLQQLVSPLACNTDM